MLILDALIAQFEQRFQYEKRASVCLWFDEKQEFLPLLPRLHSYLETREPQPFTLLQYKYDPDSEIYQGQIWLKHQIYSHVSAWHKNSKGAEKGSPTPPPPRFVLYIPLSEDRLDSPDENGENHLDLLEEYRITGVTWRINGKRPTLFTFLRQAGIKLPDSPSDQRKLYEGGKDSLLVRYVAKFLEQPQSFWATLLTPDLVQSRLVGDVEQTIFDLAVAPQATWKTLKENGLDADFVETIRDRYAFTASIEDPDVWIAEFISVLALTETFLGYTGQADPDYKAHTAHGSYDQVTEAFPFSDRLPSSPTVKQNYLNLLRRWLRDTQSRPAWDRWIKQVETNINLSQWANDQPGLAFGFPHLVRQRWEKTLAAFELAADKSSTTRSFFDRHRATIAREVEFSKASEMEIKAWSLLQDLDTLLIACSQAEVEVEKRDSVASLVTLYVEEAPRCDRLHLKVRFEAMNEMLPAIAKVADRHYASYTKALNQKFFKLYLSQNSTDISNLPTVTHKLQEKVWQAKGKKAIIIVDALRYDCAHEIQAGLSGQQVDIEPMRAQLPTVTAVGMTALMPLQNAQLDIRIHNGKLQPIVNGKDMSARSNRLAYMSDTGADCREIGHLEKISTPPDDLGELLVVFGHEQVDSIGHDEGSTLIRHLYIEIERLVLLIRKLHSWGYQTVHVVTDHGFVLLDEDQLPPEVKCKPEWCKLLKERFAIIPADADLPELNTFPCEWNLSFRIAVPPGLAFFKTEKSFSHGGATLQELVVPHLTSRVLLHQAKRIQVEVLVPKYELMQATAKVTLRGLTGARGQQDQLTLFPETGRLLNLDVLQEDEVGKRRSVLHTGKPKAVQLEAGQEENVTLFFNSSLSFKKGELLSLEIWDSKTSEKFPPGGIKLAVGRDIG